MGRLDFKSSLRRSDPAVGEFDSHTLPPNNIGKSNAWLKLKISAFLFQFLHMAYVKKKEQLVGSGSHSNAKGSPVGKAFCISDLEFIPYITNITTKYIPMMVSPNGMPQTAHSLLLIFNLEAEIILGILPGISIPPLIKSPIIIAFI